MYEIPIYPLWTKGYLGSSRALFSFLLSRWIKHPANGFGVIALTRRPPGPPKHKNIVFSPQSLNDFLDLHSEELRLELRRADSSPVSGEGKGAGGLKQDRCGEDSGETTAERRGEGRQEEPGSAENDGFSHRVHSIYQEFLEVVQGNLEGIVPVL